MAIPYRRIALYSVAAIAVLGAVVSTYLWWSTRIGRYPGLEERVAEYYALESKHQWADTYTFRVPVFRKVVPQSDYISEMEKDAKGWSMQLIKIMYAVSDQNRVKVRIKFRELAPKGHFRMPKPDKFPGLSESERAELVKYDSSLKDKAIEITDTDWSVWENIDGVWYAWETGTRGHMSLNVGLVAPQSYSGSE